jgi:hypothetical protein
MGCQAARRGASAALLEVRQEAMHGTDVRTDEATRWLQKSLKATAERACGKIGHHRKDAIMENHHKALDEIAQHARKVAEQIRQPGNRGAVGFQRDFPEAIKAPPMAGDLQLVGLALIEHQLGALVLAIDAYPKKSAE